MENLKLRPITKAQKQDIYKRSAKYIFVERDGKAKCQRCDKEFEVGKTTHLEVTKCPKCKKSMRIQHTWRMKYNLEIINWMAVPKALDEHRLVIRYVMYHAQGKQEPVIEERARMIIDESKSTPEYQCYAYDWQSRNFAWTKGKRPYFVPDTWACHNRFECHYAYEYAPNFFKEVNKLECFKYYPVENIYMMNHMVSQLHYLITTAKVNEKLSKVPALSHLVNSHLSYYMHHGDKRVNINTNKSTLVDILKLNKYTYSLFVQDPDLYRLPFLQRNPDLNLEELKAMKNCEYDYEYAKRFSRKIKESKLRVYNYCKKNNIAWWQYESYLKKIMELEYRYTERYFSLPKDFKKASEEVEKEYKIHRDAIERKKKEEADRRAREVASKLDDKYRNMSSKYSNLYMFNSSAYKVIVPDGYSDIVREGQMLHSCITTDKYKDRIFKKDCTILFVRKNTNEKMPFFTLEINKDGKIQQCRGYRNRDVIPDVYDFLSEYMKEKHFELAEDFNKYMGQVA